MLSYAIEGVQEGTLQAEKDGLYWNVTAQCSRDWPHPIRLLAQTQSGQVSLGVPAPKEDALYLKTRISNRRCPFTAETRVLTDQKPPEPPQSEPETRPETEPEIREVEPELVPFEPEKPFDRISEFSVMQIVEKDGRTWWKTDQTASPAQEEAAKRTTQS